MEYLDLIDNKKKPKADRNANDDSFPDYKENKRSISFEDAKRGNNDDIKQNINITTKYKKEPAFVPNEKYADFKNDKLKKN